MFAFWPSVAFVIAVDTCAVISDRQHYFCFLKSQISFYFGSMSMFFNISQRLLRRRLEVAARVVVERERGYGRAVQAGIAAARRLLPAEYNSNPAADIIINDESKARFFIV